MAHTISATEFRRRMMSILDEVELGESFIITYYGKMLAHIVPRHHKKIDANESPRLHADTSYTKE